MYSFNLTKNIANIIVKNQYKHLVNIKPTSEEISDIYLLIILKIKYN